MSFDRLKRFKWRLQSFQFLICLLRLFFIFFCKTLKKFPFFALYPKLQYVMVLWSMYIRFWYMHLTWTISCESRLYHWISLCLELNRKKRTFFSLHKSHKCTDYFLYFSFHWLFMPISRSFFCVSFPKTIHFFFSFCHTSNQNWFVCWDTLLNTRTIFGPRIIDGCNFQVRQYQKKKQQTN